jgi:hypothetical protein
MTPQVNRPILLPETWTGTQHKTSPLISDMPHTPLPHSLASTVDAHHSCTPCSYRCCGYSGIVLPADRPSPPPALSNRPLSPDQPLTSNRHQLSMHRNQSALRRKQQARTIQRPTVPVHHRNHNMHAHLRAHSASITVSAAVHATACLEISRKHLLPCIAVVPRPP